MSDPHFRIAKKNLHVLFLSFSLSRRAGGIFEVECSLARELQEAAILVSAAGLDDADWPQDKNRWSGIPASVFPTVGPRVFGYAPGLVRYVMDASYDLLHLHSLWMYPSVVSSAVSAQGRRPVVISPHGMLDPWALRNSGWKKKLAGLFYEKRNLQRAACIHALCQSEAQAIRKFGLKNPLAIIPNGIHIPEVRSQKSEVCHAPWKGFVEPGKKVLLFLSRIHPKKGLIPALRAWAAVQKAESGKRKAEDWILAIAGWDQGGHEAELKRLCTELSIPYSDIRDDNSEIGNRKSEMAARSRVLFLGPQFDEAKAACYAQCDGFFLPSFSEGVPMVVLEAWAHRKPVVMTPECNLPAGFERAAAIQIRHEEKLESEKLKAESGNWTIPEGLKVLFEMSEAERVQMGANGFDLVREKFAWPVIGREMADLYTWILGGGAKPGCVI